MKIAFQMDPIESINFATDSTWQLILEGEKRGEIYIYTPKDLFWREGKVLAKVSRLKIIKDNSYGLEDPKVTNLSEMDVLFIRQDPPYDMNYLTSTYLLEKIMDKVLVINNPKSIRNFPEKISVLDYQSLTAPTLITYSIEEALDFAQNYELVVIKPLYSFAGKDVFLLKSDDINFFNIIDNLIELYKTPVIIQKFLAKVSDGDKRIILIDGDPIGSFIRKPKDNDFRANLACGGDALISELNSSDQRICDIIRPMLVEHGLFFVGIDVIDGYLSEINVTSPTGLVQIKNFLNPDLITNIWDKINQKLKKC